MSRFRNLYGANPRHALGMLALFVFAGYVVSRVLEVSYRGWIAVWLLGAVVAHDLVLFPLYAALDNLVSRSMIPKWTSRVRRRAPNSASVPWINHVRVPAVVSGILLLISFPLVFRLSDSTYFDATGLQTSVYLGRWLAITAGVFGASALLFVLRVTVSRRKRRSQPAPGSSVPIGR